MELPELERYSRQTALEKIGRRGQERLRRSRVAVLGAGGLGSPAAYYLAAAGVGHLTMIDGDRVSVTNLNRQILYGEGDLGELKASAAAARLRQLNSEIEIAARPETLTDENAASLLRDHDAALLCLDSTAARRTANRALAAAGVPYVDAAVEGFYGTVMTVILGVTACYECLYGRRDRGLSGVPVLGAVAGVVGSMQALSALRLLLGVEDPARGQLLCFDGLTGQTDLLPVERDPNCPACGKRGGEKS